MLPFLTDESDQRTTSSSSFDEFSPLKFSPMGLSLYSRPVFEGDLGTILNLSGNRAISLKFAWTPFRGVFFTENTSIIQILWTKQQIYIE